MHSIPLVALVCIGTLVASPLAHAESNDIRLAKLYNSYDALEVSDGFQAANAARNGAYRSLMSQYGIAFAPMFLSPAETTGYSGFAFAAKYGMTTIAHNEDYWQNGIEGSPSSLLHTVGMEIRKGLWFPLPSFELGAGFNHVVDSRMFGLTANVKFALHEGFLHWATPAIAVRFSGTRVVGTTDVDLTVLSLDISISKSLGAAGTLNFTPYLGYNILWIIADSEVIDRTSGRDSLQCSLPGADCNNTPPAYTSPVPNGQFCTDSDCGNNYVFDDQDAILRHRIFFGLRMIYYRFAFTFEAAFTLKGNSKDTLDFQTNFNQITDRSKFQQTYSFSLAWDY